MTTNLIWYPWSRVGTPPNIDKIVDVLYRSGYTYTTLWNRTDYTFQEWEFEERWMEYPTDIVGYTFGEMKED